MARSTFAPRVAACAVLLAGVLASLCGPSEAVYGADVSQATMPGAWHCLKGEGYEFAVVRCYTEGGYPDSNCPRASTEPAPPTRMPPRFLPFLGHGCAFPQLPPSYIYISWMRWLLGVRL